MYAHVVNHMCIYYMITTIRLDPRKDFCDEMPRRGSPRVVAVSTRARPDLELRPPEIPVQERGCTPSGPLRTHVGYIYIYIYIYIFAYTYTILYYTILYYTILSSSSSRAAGRSLAAARPTVSWGRRAWRYISLSLYICIYVYIHIHIYTHNRMYLCIYVYLYVYIYIYICIVGLCRWNVSVDRAA